ncbi:HAD family hydrolase [Mycolicibacterium sp. P9-64]|uniref:HAD-IA family hydrolase n=1 Tax=Mycolicibacterium sp. P9-64 TaxID=2024612 RepID=UPI0011EC3609|nr:HAD-IA family hydrolase [Mycolicibacterium sp. P9-64]KAA0083400.1 HAD family hydrolase [Mycolicibacterium sp. P9-64]
MPDHKIDCRAVLFDCDGVLVDSREAAEHAWTEWAETLNIDPHKVLEGLHGRRSVDTVNLHVSGRKQKPALALIEETELATAQSTRPIPGGVELFAKLHSHTAVVTSASPALANARLNAAGYPAPLVVVSGSDVGTGKPSPQAYLRAAEQLHVPIQECVIFEDSPAGVEAARAARPARVIIVGGTVLPRTGEIVVRDLRQVRWVQDSLHVSTI